MAEPFVKLPRAEFSRLLGLAPSTLRLFVVTLSEVTHEAQQAWDCGEHVHVQAGAWLVSERRAAAAAGISITTLRKALDELEACRLVTVTRASLHRNASSLISLVESDRWGFGGGPQGGSVTSPRRGSESDPRRGKRGSESDPAIAKGGSQIDPPIAKKSVFVDQILDHPILAHELQSQSQSQSQIYLSLPSLVGPELQERQTEGQGVLERGAAGAAELQALSGELQELQHGDPDETPPTPQELVRMQAQLADLEQDEDPGHARWSWIREAYDTKATTSRNGRDRG